MKNTRQSAFREVYNADISRYSGEASCYMKIFHFCYRKAQTTTGIKHKLYHLLLKIHREKHGIEMSDEVSCGAGLFIGHPYNITINNRAVLGQNVNIHKGVLIGRENRGKREGAPIIGDNVWIGINAAIVGNVKVGSDVLIAPNSFINCNIPDHSVVFGNPCIVVHRDMATEQYINNRI